MELEKANKWNDYELIDSGTGYRLERFATKTLMRPDPQVLWDPRVPIQSWKWDAKYVRTREDKGKWIFSSRPFDSWTMRYKDLIFECRVSPFKHTGVFPEQSIQWEKLEKGIINANKHVKVLNLFGYTGIASLVSAKVGAQVTHVDASYPAIGWGRKNADLSKLTSAPIRWILDDVVAFVEREKRRQSTYDIIIMDPPVYGHGPKGERWDFHKDFPRLVDSCVAILSKTPLLIIINAYAVSISALTIQKVLSDAMKKYRGNTTCGELLLTDRHESMLLSTGLFARWERM